MDSPSPDVANHRLPVIFDIEMLDLNHLLALIAILYQAFV
jgi:hypothetical protein